MPGGHKLCREMGGSWNLPFHTGAGIYFEPEKKLSGNPTFHHHFIFLLEFTFHSACYLPVQQSDSANPNPLVRFWKKDFKFQIYWGLWMCCMSSYCFIWLNSLKMPVYFKRLRSVSDFHIQLSCNIFRNVCLVTVL